MPVLMYYVNQNSRQSLRFAAGAGVLANDFWVVCGSGSHIERERETETEQLSRVRVTSANGGRYKRCGPYTLRP